MKHSKSAEPSLSFPSKKAWCVFYRLLSFAAQAFDVDTDPLRLAHFHPNIVFQAHERTNKGCSNRYIDSAALSPGVPDRYHLRPVLGRHPSPLQQQQHHYAHSDPQQVRSGSISQNQPVVMSACGKVWGFLCPVPETTAAIELHHCHTVNNSLGNSLLPSPAITGANWLMRCVTILSSSCFVKLPLSF